MKKLLGAVLVEVVVYFKILTMSKLVRVLRSKLLSNKGFWYSNIKYNISSGPSPEKNALIYKFNNVHYMGRLAVQFCEYQNVELQIKSLNAIECIDQNVASVIIEKPNRHSCSNLQFLCYYENQKLYVASNSCSSKTFEKYLITISLPIKFGNFFIFLIS